MVTLKSGIEMPEPGGPGGVITSEDDDDACLLELLELCWFQFQGKVKVKLFLVSS